MIIHSRAAALALTASLNVCGAVPAHAATAKTVTIDFDHVPSGPLANFAERGFVVVPRSAGWVGYSSYGDPAPSIIFWTPANTSDTKSVSVVRYGGGIFTFTSVAIYSSITRIPYSLRGTLHGATQFDDQGIVPNTFGNFRVVTNPHANVAIDRLIISINNPATFSENPEGLDNIVLGVPATTASSR